MRLFALALALAVGLTAGSAAAQETPLRDEQITGFLASYPDMQSLGQKHKDEAPPEARPDPTNPFANTLRFMEHSSARDEFLGIAQQHGFSGLEQWTSVASRVVRAYVAVTSAQEIAQMRGEIENARRQLANDTTLTAEQKESARQQLEMTQRMIEAFSSTPEDKAAVRPYLEQIAEVMPSR